MKQGSYKEGQAYESWDVPGEVRAAPESALWGLGRCNHSFFEARHGLLGAPAPLFRARLRRWQARAACPGLSPRPGAQRVRGRLGAG